VTTNQSKTAQKRRNHELFDIEQSISQYIGRVKTGEKGDAATNLYDVYYHRLANVARGKLNRIPNPLKDEEDLAIEAMASVVRRLDAGLLEATQDRLDLWGILLVILHSKFADYVKRETAQKRGGTRMNVAQGDNGLLEELASREFTHEDEIILNDEIDFLMSKLNDQQTAILQMRIDGETNQQIAESLGLSVRFVERKVALIRDKWA
jgi:RNA polymerase sigma factor (sigma-70 family)